MKNMENLNLREIRILLGDIYFFDKNLYGQIDSSLIAWVKVQGMLEEVNDKIIKAYLIRKKGEILNDILCYTTRTKYPDRPSMED